MIVLYIINASLALSLDIKLYIQLKSIITLIWAKQKKNFFFFGESNWVEKTNYEGEQEDRRERPKRNVNETASVESKKKKQNMCREVKQKMLSCSFRRLGTYFWNHFSEINLNFLFFLFFSGYCGEFSKVKCCDWILMRLILHRVTYEVLDSCGSYGLLTLFCIIACFIDDSCKFSLDIFQWVCNEYAKFKKWRFRKFWKIKYLGENHLA